MTLKLKRTRDQVMVITGASSGIGLTTAEMAAAEGARVVLNSRNETDLRRTCERIAAHGGRAVYVVGDVADPDAMEMAANRAISEFGGLDTWVNNAGIGMYGRLTQMSMADKRRLFDVNFWGVVNGCRAALRHLRSRGGAIINVGSVTSDRAIPLLGMYSASKHAVKGYTDALRMELEEEGAPIAVTLVKPASINTPFTEHARNYMEEEPEFAGMVYPPEEVARAILRSAERPMRDVTVGGGGKVMSMMGVVAPRVTDVVMERTLFKGQKKDEPRRSADALREPQQDGRRYGRRERHTMQRSAYTRAAMSDVSRVLPILAIGALLAAGVHTLRKAS
jgi:NAD(P)-dependent dehydrogenase (short-subunit alcohol dehydrogenase family)